MNTGYKHILYVPECKHIVILDVNEHRVHTFWVLMNTGYKRIRGVNERPGVNTFWVLMNAYNSVPRRLRF